MGFARVGSNPTVHDILSLIFFITMFWLNRRPILSDRNWSEVNITFRLQMLKYVSLA